MAVYRPNELTTFEDDKGNDILLVSDGFLMPGQSNGGLYAIVSNKLSKSKVKLSTKGIHAHPIRLTKPKAGWFYHRATYVRLSDGKQGIITARAHKPLFHPGQGELVWLHLPPDMVWHRDVSTDKGSLHSLSSSHQDIITDDSDVELPEYLDEMVLAIGPDVMFEILDRNRPDGTIDIVSAHFFNEKLSIHTIKSIENSPFVEVVKTSTIDTVGQPYGLCLATFPSTEPTIQTDSTESTRDCQYKSFKSSNQPEETSRSSKPTHLLVSTHECSYDIPSTINMALSALSGIFPRIRTGYPREFRDGESLPVENGRNSVWGKKGGSLFAYKIPNEIQQGVIDMNKNNHEEEKTLSHYSSSSEYNVSETRMTAKELQGMRNHDVYGSLALSLNDTTIHSMNDPQDDRRLRQQRTTELSLDGDKHQLRHWSRQTLFRGFKVRGWGGIFSPGAPGFPYVVSLPNSHNPLILLAGDCTGSAYIFSPCNSSYHDNNSMSENIPEYDLAFEVECGATVRVFLCIIISDLRLPIVLRLDLSPLRRIQTTL